MSPVRSTGALAFAILHSGCAGGDGAGASAPDITVAFTEDLGAIEGLVTDVEQRPLEGARVWLDGVEREAATDATGAFLLPQVPPGEQVLHVEAAGHYPKNATVAVLANAVVDHTFALEPRPLEEPYVEILAFRGYAVCEFNAVLIVYGPGPVAGCDQQVNVFTVAMADSWRHLIVEVAWPGQEALHVVSDTNTLCLFGTESTDPCFNWVTGRSPVRFDGQPNGSWELAPPDFAYPAGGFDWVVHTAGAGLFQREIAQSPVCSTFRPNGPECSGVGMNLGFAFDLWISVFHHDAWETLETYTQLPDE